MNLSPVSGPYSYRYLVPFDVRRQLHQETDVLVVGGGVAGLSAALCAAEAGKDVFLLMKADIGKSNTSWAQGGIAAVLTPEQREEGDSNAQHIQDTIKAGAGLCDEDTVREIVKGGSEAIDFLLSHGCRFDREGQDISLTREGGHQARRILHYNGDATGKEISRSLSAAVLAHPNINLITRAFVIDILTHEDHAVGALYKNSKDEICAIFANAVILACGGAGQIFRETSNPNIATGDGLAMAYRAGATLVDMEFMQFHPTSLYIAGHPRRLITEAMRGEGAYLRNNKGERFMINEHELAELAPRDVVARAIVNQVQIGGFPHVWLDATHLNSNFVYQRFPTIAAACKEVAIDIAKDWIPVSPSAHYHCGGVHCNMNGATNVPGLFVAGEVAASGLHGANRLASNSLLEAIVLGIRSGNKAAESPNIQTPIPIRHKSDREWDPEENGLDIVDIKHSLQSLMWRNVGIQRDAQGLDYAKRSLNFWVKHQARVIFRDQRGWELQNLLCAASLMVRAAAARTASVGTHYRSDSSNDIITNHYSLTREVNT